MNITANECDNQSTLVLSVEGRLDATTAPEFEKILDGYLENESKNIFILNLTEVNYVSSAGLRIFLKVIKALKTRNGQLHLCGLSEEIAEIFTISGFTAFLKMAATVEDCLTAAGN